MSDQFNNTSNPGLIDPSENRHYVDSLKSTNSQLKEILLSGYEPNKFKDQQEFNAVVLKQLDNKGNHFRVIARIPEVHCMLPIPKDENDARTISLYPTFTGIISNHTPQITERSLSVGSTIVVTFENMTNFSGPKVIRVQDVRTPSSSTSGEEPPPGGTPNIRTNTPSEEIEIISPEGINYGSFERLPTKSENHKAARDRPRRPPLGNTHQRADGKYLYQHRGEWKGWLTDWIRPTETSDTLPQVGTSRYFGLDVSYWQGDIENYFVPLIGEINDSFDKGIKFCWIKVSHGTGDSNKHLAEQFVACKGAGIATAPYHWCSMYHNYQDRIRNISYTDNAAIKEVAETRAMAEFAKFKSRYRAENRDWDLTPALDLEGTAKAKLPANFGAAQARLGRWNTDNVRLHKYVLFFMLKMCSEIKNDIGSYPIIYTNSGTRWGWLRFAFLTMPSEFVHLGKISYLWLAQYDRTASGLGGGTQSDPHVPNAWAYPATSATARSSRHSSTIFKQTTFPWKQWDVWQYTGFGRFEGIHSNHPEAVKLKNELKDAGEPKHKYVKFSGGYKFDFNAMKKDSFNKLICKYEG